MIEEIGGLHENYIMASIGRAKCAFDVCVGGICSAWVRRLMNAGTWAGIAVIVGAGALSVLAVWCACVVSGRLSRRGE